MKARGGRLKENPGNSHSDTWKRRQMPSPYSGFRALKRNRNIWRRIVPPLLSSDWVCNQGLLSHMLTAPSLGRGNRDTKCCVLVLCKRWRLPWEDHVWVSHTCIIRKHHIALEDLLLYISQNNTSRIIGNTRFKLGESFNWGRIECVIKMNSSIIELETYDYCIVFLGDRHLAFTSLWFFWLRSALGGRGKEAELHFAARVF